MMPMFCLFEDMVRVKRQEVGQRVNSIIKSTTLSWEVYNDIKRVNSLPVNMPYMMQLEILSFKLRNRHWGWRSGIDRVLLLARTKFKTDLGKARNLVRDNFSIEYILGFHEYINTS